jgi:hypothetical protein
MYVFIYIVDFLLQLNYYTSLSPILLSLESSSFSCSSSPIDTIWLQPMKHSTCGFASPFIHLIMLFMSDSSHLKLSHQDSRDPLESRSDPAMKSMVLLLMVHKYLSVKRQERLEKQKPTKSSE